MKKPLVIWFTGLSGAGKTTLAEKIAEDLEAKKIHFCHLDGDVLRTGLCSDLGFSEQDRHENQRRIRELVKILMNTGVTTLVSFISPFQKDRDAARAMFGDRFIEVYVETPLSECEKRDVKGLYKKARNGEISSFTGIDSPYESPLNPEITVGGHGQSIDAAVAQIKSVIHQAFSE